MAETFDIEKLSLDEADLDFEEREAREARRRSEISDVQSLLGALHWTPGHLILRKLLPNWRNHLWLLDRNG